MHPHLVVFLCLSGWLSGGRGVLPVEVADVPGEGARDGVTEVFLQHQVVGDRSALCTHTQELITTLSSEITTNVKG